MLNNVNISPSLPHGGQLKKVAKQYAIPIEQWLDLSTGIAPTHYPIPVIPAEVWKQLPQTSDALQIAANQYYQTENILPIAGSQAIIQILPQLAKQQGYNSSKVWLPKIGYKEHQKAWQDAGYWCNFYNECPPAHELNKRDILVLINPNNPSGKLYSYHQVEQLFAQVQQQDGLLIIDEAFMDCTPEHSFIKNTASPNLIILRSVGKFFGLAGLRLGFVSAAEKWLTLFEQHFGPWAINGPAQYIGQYALSDTNWQNQQRDFLQSQSEKLARLLGQTFAQEPKGTPLFKTISCPRAELVFTQLCQQGIYLRLCDEKNALRFGIPNNDDLLRLESVLDRLFINT